MIIPKTKTPTRDYNHSRQGAFIGECFSLSFCYGPGTAAADKKVLVLDLRQVLNASAQSLCWPEYETICISKKFVRVVPATETGLDIITPNELDLLAHGIEPNFLNLEPVLKSVIHQRRALAEKELATLIAFISLHIARSPLVAGRALMAIKGAMIGLSKAIQVVGEIAPYSEPNGLLTNVISILEEHTALDSIIPHVSSYILGETQPERLAYKIEDETWSKAILDQYHLIVELFSNYPIYGVLDRSGFPIKNVSHPNHFLCGAQLSLSELDKKHLTDKFFFFIKSVSDENPPGVRIFRDANHELEVKRCFLSSDLPSTIWGNFIAGPISRDLFITFLSKEHEVLLVPFMSFLSQGVFDLLSATHGTGQIICPDENTMKRLYCLFSSLDRRAFDRL